MLIKAGVDISRLNPEIRRTLTPLAKAWRLEEEELVITSTYEGNHLPSSLHYHNDAIDVRWPMEMKKGRADFAKKIAAMLGRDFDVVPELNHLHIEYDPKGQKESER